jgi:hypothetical protein
MCILYSYEVFLKFSSKCIHPNYLFYCFECWHRVCPNLLSAPCSILCLVFCPSIECPVIVLVLGEGVSRITGSSTRPRQAFSWRVETRTRTRQGFSRRAKTRTRNRVLLSPRSTALPTVLSYWSTIITMTFNSQKGTKYYNSNAIYVGEWLIALLLPYINLPIFYTK